MSEPQAVSCPHATESAHGRHHGPALSTVTTGGARRPLAKISGKTYSQSTPFPTEVPPTNVRGYSENPGTASEGF